MRSRVKLIAKSVLGRLAEEVFMRLPSSYGLRIVLTYHRVLAAPPDGLHDYGMYVTEKTLRTNIEQLSRVFKVVPLGELVRDEASVNCCAITLDDGWRDNYENAFPVFKKLGVSPTIFLPTRLVGTPGSFWFQDVFRLADRCAKEDKAARFFEFFQTRVPDFGGGPLDAPTVKRLVEAMKRLEPRAASCIAHEGYEGLDAVKAPERELLDWEEVLQMARGGVQFGSHGKTHAILPTLDREFKADEVFGSLRDLEERGLSSGETYLSYPNGDYDDETVTMAREAGYRGAVSTRFGTMSGRPAAFEMGRISMHEYVCNSKALFWYRVWQAFRSSNLVLRVR